MIAESSSAKKEICSKVDYQGTVCPCPNDRGQCVTLDFKLPTLDIYTDDATADKPLFFKWIGPYLVNTTSTDPDRNKFQVLFPKTKLKWQLVDAGTTMRANFEIQRELEETHLMEPGVTLR